MGLLLAVTTLLLGRWVQKRFYGYTVLLCLRLNSKQSSTTVCLGSALATLSIHISRQLDEGDLVSGVGSSELQIVFKTQVNLEYIQWYGYILCLFLFLSWNFQTFDTLLELLLNIEYVFMELSIITPRSYSWVLVVSSEPILLYVKLLFPIYSHYVYLH